MKLITHSGAIKGRLEDMDVTQAQAAEHLGWTRGHVNSVVKGRNTSIKTAYKMAYYLGGSFDDYFEVKNEDIKQHN